MPHGRRPRFRATLPVHVTARMVPGLRRLRTYRLVGVLRQAFLRGCQKPGFRICQFSIQGNHIHMVCEADNVTRLARGVQGWAVRVARGLNRRLERKGRVFADRYHAKYIRSPRQMRSTLCYVLNNARRHSERLSPRWNGIESVLIGLVVRRLEGRGLAARLVSAARENRGASPVLAAHRGVARPGTHRRGGGAARRTTPLKHRGDRGTAPTAGPSADSADRGASADSAHRGASADSAHRGAERRQRRPRDSADRGAGRRQPPSADSRRAQTAAERRQHRRRAGRRQR